MVAKGLKGRFGLRSLVVGSGAEAGLAGEIVSGAEGAAISLAGRTGLKELAAIFEMCAFVVSVDTGPMHLAVAAGARVIALFGPTAPWRTGPYGRGHVVLQKALSCSPCFKRRCHEPRCMLDITPDDVMEAAGRIVASALRQSSQAEGPGQELS
jgi:heptosyltransferase-1